VDKHFVYPLYTSNERIAKTNNMPTKKDPILPKKRKNLAITYAIAPAITPEITAVIIPVSVNDVITASITYSTANIVQDPLSPISAINFIKTIKIITCINHIII